MSHRYWKKNDKFYCSECEQLLFEFAQDMFYGDKFQEASIKPGVGQKFQYLDPMRCKNCGWQFWEDLKKGKIE